ncbi:hypothetical protein BHM03_00022857, partial [Ensete ventricosum]
MFDSTDPTVAEKQAAAANGSALKKPKLMKDDDGDTDNTADDPNALSNFTISKISTRFLKQDKQTADLVGNEKLKASTDVRHLVPPWRTGRAGLLLVSSEDSCLMRRLKVKIEGVKGLSLTADGTGAVFDVNAFLEGMLM